MLQKLFLQLDPNSHVPECQAMDLVVCFTRKITQFCGQTLKRLCDHDLQSDFIDCAISQQIYFLTPNFQLQKQYSMIAVCVLTTQALEVY
jgi:hypothetical protein